MKQLTKGSFCKSNAGHDKDSIYIIVETQSGIWVSDGKYKKLENPKRKNPKHIEVIEYKDPLIEAKLETGKLQNEDLKYSIKKYLNSIKSKQEVNECLKQM